MTWTDGLPEHLRLQVGQEWRTDLRSGAGGGYLWTVSGDSPAAVCEVLVGPLPPPGDPPDAVAAPVALQVHGRAPGTARFRLRLARPWDASAVLAQAQLVVEVGAPG